MVGSFSARVFGRPGLPAEFEPLSVSNPLLVSGSDSSRISTDGVKRGRSWCSLVRLASCGECLGVFVE